MDPLDDRDNVFSQANSSCDLADFTLLVTIGGGNTAKTVLAETRADRQLRVIKAVSKSNVIQNGEMQRMISQKYMLSQARMTNHPLIVHLHSTFQNESWLFFVTEFISGGDLMFHVQKARFEPSQARFYAAEVCLALEFVHSQNIIHRSLSLDNILLTRDGHVKLTGFGSSKQLTAGQQKTNSFAGTAEFIAPEMLLDREYSFPLDWWCFAVILYQMLLQQSPFPGDDMDEIYDAILMQEPSYPTTMSQLAISLLQGLFKRDPEQRLGSKNGARDVREHPFFAEVDWGALYKLEVMPPFKPSVTAEVDISNFNIEWTKSALPVLDASETTLSGSDQLAFEGF